MITREIVVTAEQRAVFDRVADGFLAQAEAAEIPPQVVCLWLGELVGLVLGACRFGDDEERALVHAVISEIARIRVASATVLPEVLMRMGGEGTC